MGDSYKYTVAETFVGAGGSHLGFKNNAFKTLYINEWSKDCIDTLKYNNPEIFKNTIIDNKDINDIDLNFLSKKLKNKVDVLFGGVVCKGFSLVVKKAQQMKEIIYIEGNYNWLKHYNRKLA